MRLLKVFAIAMLVPILLMTAACADKQITTLRKADLSVYEALGGVQDAVDVLHNSAILNDAQYQAINKKHILPLLNAGKKFNLAVMVWKPGMPAPAELTEITNLLAGMIVDLQNYLPASAQGPVLTAVAIAQVAILAVMGQIASAGIGG